jgi:hypothetical protein
MELIKKLMNIDFKRNRKELSVEERLRIKSQRLLWSEERLTTLRENKKFGLSVYHNKF